MSALKPAGWFNPYNDYHGYQQVAPEFEGKGDTIPLYQLPPGYVILSPDEVRGIERDRQAVEFAARWCWRTDPPHASSKLTDAERLSAIKYHPTIKQEGLPHVEMAARESSLKGDRDAQ